MNDTINPVYFENLVIEKLNVDIHGECLPLVVNVYDQDKLSREFAGTAVVDLREAEQSGVLVMPESGRDSKPKPGWFTLKQNGQSSGRFLIGLVLIRNQTLDIPKQIKIPSQLYKITLMMVGLRGMHSSGLLPVKRPYIIFDYDSICVYGQSKGSKNIQTQPKSEGSSVNIHTVNNCQLYLPEDPDYWPSLSATVKDYVLGGVYEPILGHFSINLKQAFERSHVFQQRASSNQFASMLKDSLANLLFGE